MTYELEDTRFILYDQPDQSSKEYRCPSKEIGEYHDRHNFLWVIMSDPRIFWNPEEKKWRLARPRIRSIKSLDSCDTVDIGTEPLNLVEIDDEMMRNLICINGYGFYPKGTLFNGFDVNAIYVDSEDIIGIIDGYIRISYISSGLNRRSNTAVLKDVMDDDYRRKIESGELWNYKLFPKEVVKVAMYKCRKTHMSRKEISSIIQEMRKSFTDMQNLALELTEDPWVREYL